jgi:hypothetical protein
VVDWGSLVDSSIICASTAGSTGGRNPFPVRLVLEYFGAGNLCFLGRFVGVSFGSGSIFGFEMQSSLLGAPVGVMPGFLFLISVFSK